MTSFLLESNSRQGDTHTAHDRKITQKELEQNQARMNILSRGLAKTFKLGENWGDKNASRCWTNSISDSCVAPLLYPSPKTHKPLDEQGDPRTLPIVQASSCVTSRPAEILADVLEAALQSFPRQSECASTEEMLTRIDKANDDIRSRGVNVCVGSGDAVSLYPSLRHRESARLCAEMMLKCPATMSNLDVGAAAVFVATHCTSTEVSEACLGKVVSARKHILENFPTPGTPELTT